MHDTFYPFMQNYKLLETNDMNNDIEATRKTLLVSNDTCFSYTHPYTHTNRHLYTLRNMPRVGVRWLGISDYVFPLHVDGFNQIIALYLEVVALTLAAMNICISI